jgi:DDE_Tnp_1-associated
MTVSVGAQAGRTLWVALAETPDRRGRKGRQYPLTSVLGLELAAMLSGADDLMAIFRWARVKHDKDPLSVDDLDAFCARVGLSTDDREHFVDMRRVRII